MTSLSNPQVVVTGCELFIPNREKWVHGDLWHSGDQWIFNACVDDVGMSAWVFNSVPPAHTRQLIVLLDKTFERRGVIVVPKACCKLNDVAEAHTAKWGPNVY